MIDFDLFSLWWLHSNKWRVSVASFQFDCMSDRRALLEIERTGTYNYYCIFYVFRKVVV